ncbi:MAG: hypothetical protein IJC50_00400 [Clostridia bacterium]|nr:hypothetical protein [Clostridia bacterium]
MYYILHDYEIDSVTFEENKIVFSFPEGFYVEDQHGKDVTPLRHKLIFTIDRSGCDNESVESFVEIRRRKRFGWKEISVKQFLALFKKGNMFIHDEYDSRLTNCKMLMINTNTKWNNIEMFITDIEDVLCQE